MKVVGLRNGGSLAMILAIWFSLILMTSAAGQNSLDTKGGDAQALDTGLLITAELLLAADAFQTRYISKSDDYEELNPILRRLGSNGVYPYFLFFMLAVPLTGEYLIPEWKTEFYGTVCTLQAFTVGRNFSLGIGFAF